MEEVVKDKSIGVESEMKTKAEQRVEQYQKEIDEMDFGVITEKQLEVIELLYEGKTMADVGRELGKTASAAKQLYLTARRRSKHSKK